MICNLHPHQLSRPNRIISITIRNLLFPSHRYHFSFSLGRRVGPHFHNQLEKSAAIDSLDWLSTFSALILLRECYLF